MRLRQKTSFALAATLAMALLVAPPPARAQDQQTQEGPSAEETVRDVGRILQGGQAESVPVPTEPIPDPNGAAQNGDVTQEPAPPPRPVTVQAIPGRLFARLTEETGALGSGVRWRVYASKPASDGTHPTVASSDEAQPVIAVPPGEYVAVAVFGHAVGTKTIKVGEEAFREGVTLNAGALRMTSLRSDGRQIPPKQVSLSIFGAEVDDFGERELLVENAQPGRVIVLNAGSYHVVSQYGDANSTVRDDVKVEAAQMTDTQIMHAAAPVTLKLVTRPGGEALANTGWSVLTPGGDIVKESFGAFPTHILAAGDYSVIARHEGQLYNRDFAVQPGTAIEIEVLAQN